MYLIVVVWHCSPTKQHGSRHVDVVSVILPLPTEEEEEMEVVLVNSLLCKDVCVCQHNQAHMHS